MTRTHFMIVRQEHLNQYGSLFGGRVLSVIDELAFIACSRNWKGRNFVTRAVRDAEFTAPARLGDIIEFSFSVAAVGTSSVTVHVEMVVHDHEGLTEPVVSFDGDVIMVCVDSSGAPQPVGPPDDPAATAR